MPLYDYACHHCKQIREVFHLMSDETPKVCPDCDGQMEKLISPVYTKRPDAEWIQCINGVVNDLEFVQKGRQEKIETREQARKRISQLYADPHPEPQNDNEIAANKRVGTLRQRYLERF